MEIARQRVHAWSVTTRDAAEIDRDDFDDDFAVPERRRPWFVRDVPMGVFLIVTAVIGYLASFELSNGKVEILKHPDAQLSCDLNPFFSCGSVMQHWQSEIFGFPNQFLGIGAFVFPLLLGVLLVSRHEIRPWIMVGLNIGLLAGVALVMFLFYASIYAIGIGCPWCMVVWVVTILEFCAVTARNTLTGAFGRGLQESTAARTLASSPILIGCVWLLVIAVCIVTRFWVYFGGLLT